MKPTYISQRCKTDAQASKNYVIQGEPLSQFCIFISLLLHFYADCSSKLANSMPPPLPRSYCTRFSTSSHPYSVHLSNSRVNLYLHSFICYTGKPWNFLPFPVFAPAYDLMCFKRKDSRHL